MGNVGGERSCKRTATLVLFEFRRLNNGLDYSSSGSRNIVLVKLIGGLAVDHLPPKTMFLSLAFCTLCRSDCYTATATAQLCFNGFTVSSTSYQFIQTPGITHASAFPPSVPLDYNNPSPTWVW